MLTFTETIDCGLILDSVKNNNCGAHGFGFIPRPFFLCTAGNLLAKLDRVEEIYKAKVPDTPQIVFDIFKTQRERLNAAKDKLGECISPFDL